MGDKANARETMRESGLPVIPGSRGTLPRLEDGLKLAGEIGFPVLLKATAGGGGKGMRRVDTAGEFEQKYREASLEAEKAFGNPGLYMEKYIVDGRHIEFQVMADAFGEVVHLSERECSAQRRHQKLVEEAPSPVVDARIRRDLGQKLRGAVQYIDIWKLSLDGQERWERITHFTDYEGYKSSNPVVSDDGRYIAFQMARRGDPAGVGRGLFLLDIQAMEAARKAGAK